jgi:hypothetical protein
MLRQGASGFIFMLAPLLTAGTMIVLSYVGNNVAGVVT